MTIRLQPHAARASIIGDRHETNPPGWFLVARERTKTESLESAVLILILSASSAPPLRGEDGSTARTAILSPLSAQLEISLPIRVDLPTPGGPVTPRVQEDCSGMSNAPPFSITVSILAKSLRLPVRAESRRLAGVTPIAIPSSHPRPRARRPRFAVWRPLGSPVSQWSGCRGQKLL